MSNKILVLLACHTNTKRKYFSTLNNIKAIENYVQDIVVINSNDACYNENLKDDLKNYSKITNYYQVKNDNHFDFGKWIYALSNICIDQYDFVLFMNDSILIMNDIVNFFYFFDNLSNKINVYAYNDSTQNNVYHYQSYLFFLNTKIIDKFIDLFKQKKNLIKSKDTLIEHMEMNLIHLDEKHDCFLKLGKEWNSQKNIFWENEKLYKHLITKNIFHLFKLKQIDDIYEHTKLELNNELKNIQEDYYLNRYSDLNEKNLNKQQLLQHYHEYGFNEGRKINKNPYSILPNYYRNFLKNIHLNSFFCLNSEFDVCYYKKNNTSIQHLNLHQTITHYYKYGIENDECYFKNNTYNYQDKNKNYSHFVKVFLDKHITLPINFNLYEYIQLNKKNEQNYSKKGFLNVILDFYEHKMKYYNYQDIKNEINMDYFKDIFPQTRNLNTEGVYAFFFKHYKNTVFHKIPEKELIEYSSNNNIYYNKNRVYAYYYHKYKSHLVDKNEKDLPPQKNEKALPQQKNEKALPQQKNEKALPQQKNEKALPPQKNEKDLPPQKNEKALPPQKNEKTLIQTNSQKEVIDNTHENNQLTDFDVKVYKLLNKDLQEFSDQDATDHYFTMGIKEQRLYKIPDDFSVEAYKHYYSTEFKHMSDDQLKEHFLHNGYHEKRNYKLPYYFNIDIYRLLNTRVKNLDTKKTIEYFLNHDYPNDSYKDKFIDFYSHTDNKKLFDTLNLIPKDFNPKIYKLLYDDIKELTMHQLKNHYFNHGVHEQRKYKLVDDFNVNMYKYFNPDLKKLKHNELIRHYVFFGEKENRNYKLPLNFDVSLYKKLNPDLKKLNDDKLVQHFLTMGFAEGRPYFIPNDFDPEIYKTLYVDLKKLNNDDLTIHYVTKGIKEKRIYNIPYDFDPEEYKKFYDDLKNLSNENSLYHYVSNGIHEKRIYKVPEDFNTKRYRELHFDLQFMNDFDVYEHFITHGIQENRQYKGYNKYFKDPNNEHKTQEDTDIKTETVTDDISVVTVETNTQPTNKEDTKTLSNENTEYLNSLPSDFTIKGYKLFNSDLIYFNKDEYLIKHYLDIGIDEGRIYKMPDDFDYELYQRLNPELDIPKKNDAINHFKQYGNVEKRLYKIPHDFDCVFYKNMYLDKNKKYLNEEIIDHYLNEGIQNKHLIKIPDDFDISIFKKLNIDLKDVNDILITKRFINGEYKDRIYK